MTIGSLIGPYRIVEKIGAGGMGQVFLAEHTLLGRRAAVKTLLPALSAHHEIIERFFNEARATSAITDPGVVQIFDFGYHVDGTAYIVMELLEGESLADRIERLGTLPLADALRIVRQCAGSIAAAHACGIVHRDLKPENIFLVRDPEASGGERPKVLDFGICKLATSDAMTTQTGTMFGTPAYMSPEQCRGAGAIDQRSDIYAFGCLLFHMLTGRPPFWKDAPGELLVAHMHEAPPSPSDFVPSIPAEVDAAVLRCLAKDPADRFASMTDLQATIAQLELDAAIDAAPDVETQIDAAIDAAPDIDITVDGEEPPPRPRTTPVPRTARRMSVATPRPTPPPSFSTGASRDGSGPHRADAGVLSRARWNDSGEHVVPRGRWTEPQDDDVVPPRRKFRGLRALFLSVMVIGEIAVVIAIVLSRSAHHQPAAMPEPVAVDPMPAPVEPLTPPPADPAVTTAEPETTAPTEAEIERAIAGMPGPTAAPVSADKPAAAAPVIDKPAVAADKPAAAAAPVIDKPAVAAAMPAATKTVPPRAKHAVAKKPPPAPRQHPAPAPIVIEPRPVPQPPTTEELYETR